MERDYLLEQINIAEDKLSVLEGFFIGLGIGLVCILFAIILVVL